MKRDDILKIADQYRLLRQSNIREDLLDFAAEVAEAEREDCAKVCGAFADSFYASFSTFQARAALDCMKAIKARGKE